MEREIDMQLSVLKDIRKIYANLNAEAIPQLRGRTECGSDGNKSGDSRVDGEVSLTPFASGRRAPAGIACCQNCK